MLTKLCNTISVLNLYLYIIGEKIPIGNIYNKFNGFYKCLV